MNRLLLLLLVACSSKASTEATPPAPVKPTVPAKHEGTGAMLTGTVTDTTAKVPAANVEVVFRSTTRDETARTDSAGKFRLAIPNGTYRAFVRDDSLMTVGFQDRVRVPVLPPASAAGALDEALAPSLVVDGDADIDLSVVRSGVVTGTVADIEGHMIGGAVVSAHGNNLPRPALGTDVAITRADGSFELRLPDGEYVLAASHKSYADSVDVGRIETVKGGNHHVALTMVKGCVVTGKVVDASGKLATEGAIEKKVGLGDNDFSPNARIDSDGTFRWTTTDETEITLRAWPWHAPPSAAKKFNCRDNARLTTTFTLPAQPPDLSGRLVDPSGAPIAFTHIDIAPLDPGGIAQLERTDERGTWQVFQLVPGRYSITSQGRAGVVSAPVTSPGNDVTLKLGGIGRISGTTTQLARGSFEVSFGACLDGNTVQLPHDRRIVVVTNGRFTIENVPACDIQFDVVWHGETISTRTVVPANGTARVLLDVGEPREKIVAGVVRDRDGHGVGKAHVTATYRKHSTTAITDEDGHFSVGSYAGASLAVDHAGARGEAEVGLANVPKERVEIVLVDRR